MKLATKIVFLACLVSIVIVPIALWAIDPSRDLSTVAGFVGAAAAPMGVLTGAMAARGISKDRKPKQ